MRAIETLWTTLISVLGLAPAAAQHPASRGTEVVINNQPLTAAEISAIERLVHGRLVAGRYWYDRVAGLWGYEGGPTVGFALAGLSVGGALQADASHGDTRVFFNGRELHRREVAYLMTLGPVLPGRYTLNAYGFVSFEGQSTPFAHLPTLHAIRWGPPKPSNPGGGSYIGSGDGCLYITGKSSSGIGSWGASTC